MRVTRGSLAAGEPQGDAAPRRQPTAEAAAEARKGRKGLTNQLLEQDFCVFKCNKTTLGVAASQFWALWLRSRRRAIPD